MSNLLIVILSVVKISLDLFDDRSLYIYIQAYPIWVKMVTLHKKKKKRKHKSLLNLHFDGSVIVQVCENKMHSVWKALEK